MFEDRLAEICALDPHELTPSDREFIRARASYLSEAEAVKFAEVLEGVVIPEKEEEKDVRVEDPKEAEEEVTSDDLPLPEPKFQ